MKRFTVMGFTEAELGFVVAAALAALVAASDTERARLEPAAVQREAARARADSLRDSLDSLTRVFAAYRDSIGKRSNKTPACSEKGEPPGAVADVALLGRDRFLYDGDRLSFSELETRLDSLIRRSRRLGCRYLVRTHAVRGVDGPETAAAARRVRADFDVDERDR
jgi:hypothetical protein